MPSSHIASYFHIVFSTKERLPMISGELLNRLHAYLGGIVNGLDAVPLQIGGVSDHVHILASLRSKHRLDYFVRDLKADSSTWVHAEFSRMFEWQKGYGAFSVSPNAIAGVRKYIANQESHHSTRSFKDEYVDLLTKSGTNFDETYLW